MNINVVCVGKIKENFYKEAICEYSKRLSKYCSLSIIEVPDEKTPDRCSDNEKNMILSKEGKRILSKIKDNEYVILLAIEGKKYDSVAFSEELSKLFVGGTSDVTFVIGGSLGASSEVYQRADLKISFSDMTFPHQLMRVILLEQIYRAFRIQKNEPYHK